MAGLSEEIGFLVFAGCIQICTYFNDMALYNALVVMSS